MTTEHVDGSRFIQYFPSDALHLQESAKNQENCRLADIAIGTKHVIQQLGTIQLKRDTANTKFLLQQTSASTSRRLPSWTKLSLNRPGFRYHIPCRMVPSSSQNQLVSLVGARLLYQCLPRLGPVHNLQLQFDLARAIKAST